MSAFVWHHVAEINSFHYVSIAICLLTRKNRFEMLYISFYWRGLVLRLVLYFTDRAKWRQKRTKRNLCHLNFITRWNGSFDRWWNQDFYSIRVILMLTCSNSWCNDVNFHSFEYLVLYVRIACSNSRLELISRSNACSIISHRELVTVLVGSLCKKSALIPIKLTN